MKVICNSALFIWRQHFVLNWKIFKKFLKIFEKFLKIFKTTKNLKIFEKLNFFWKFQKIKKNLKKKNWSRVQALFLLEYRNAIPQRITRGVWKFPMSDHRKSESNSCLRVTSESKKVSSKSTSAEGTSAFWAYFLLSRVTLREEFGSDFLWSRMGNFHTPRVIHWGMAFLFCNKHLRKGIQGGQRAIFLHCNSKAMLPSYK